MSAHHDPPGEDPSDRLFAWAVIAPVLTRHYSIVRPADQKISACVCSPGIRRSVDQWARHVSDVIADSIT